MDTTSKKIPEQKFMVFMHKLKTNPMELDLDYEIGDVFINHYKDSKSEFLQVVEIQRNEWHNITFYYVNKFYS